MTLDKMEAIAYGVQARFEENTGYSKRVTDATINVARALGVPEPEIEKWATARNKLYSGRERRIQSALNKLERNPMAQVMLGLTHSASQFPKSSREQN